jgi:DNA-binding protein HU-beta
MPKKTLPTKISKTDFITKLGYDLGIPKTQAEIVYNTFTDNIIEHIASGEIVNLTGFGKFYPITRTARNGVNPRTGKKIIIKAKKSAGFKLGKEFKDKILSK